MTVAATFVPVTETLRYVAGDTLSWTRWYIGEDLTADTIISDVRRWAFTGTVSTLNPVLATIVTVTSLETDPDVRATLVTTAAADGVTLDLTGVDVTRFDFTLDTTALRASAFFDVERDGGTTIYRGELVAVGQVST